MISRRIALALLPASLGLDAARAAAAAAPPRYAVLSLVGDEIVLVNRRMRTGSNIDSNERSAIPIAATSLDDAAFAGADAAIHVAEPTAEALRFSIRDPRLYTLQERLVVPVDANDEGLRDALRKVCVDQGVARLIVVTKRRGDARFGLYEGSIGDGKVAGAGFYLDRHVRTAGTDSGERATGFLGTFASLAVWLVDPASWRVIASRPGYAQRLDTAAGNRDAVTAWDAMTPQRKVNALEAVIREATSGAVAPLLEPSAAATPAR